MFDLDKISVNLKADDIPKQWYNFLSDLPGEIPPTLDPEGEESKIELMKKISPKILQDQNSLKEKWVDIPYEVLSKYITVGRPTRLVRAVNLEKYLDTPARIYFKREDDLCTGSFKPNTSIAQAYYLKKENYRGLVTQTGAGQWGLACAMACSFFDLECTVFIPAASYDHKSMRRMQAKLYGAEFLKSPSPLTKSGRKLLDIRPDHPGSVNSGISDAIEYALENEGLAYVNGSNITYTLLHNTVIGLETQKQLEMLGEKPDVLIACVGGGSNMGGFMFPFLKQCVENKVKFVAVESKSAPRLTEGEYKYEHGDPGKLTPLNKAYTLGHDFIPPVMHVGGLRQHGGSPTVSYLKHEGYLDAKAYTQDETFKAGQLFSKLEGILPAPETCHAIKGVMDEALQAKEEGTEKVIVGCFSGHGFLDLSGYEAVLL